MKRTGFLLTVALFSNSALSAISRVNPIGGGVEILAIGKPSFIKIRGTGNQATGSVTIDGQKLDGQFEFDLGTLDTGIDLRNEHMREKYLEVKKFPRAKLELKDVSLPSGWSLTNTKTAEIPFKGRLTMHGSTQEVSGTFQVQESSAVSAAFKIKLSDFKIEIPEYMGVKVADEVNVNVKFDRLQAEQKNADARP